MNYNFMPSLEHMTLVKIAAALWNQDDIRAEIRFLVRHSQVKKKWLELELKVIEKTSQLSGPNSLKTKTIGYIKPVGYAIENWIYMINSYLSISSFRESGYMNAVLPNSFCWTPQGLIDQKKMAKILVKDERLRISTRYRLARYFCLVDDIVMLGRKLYPYRKRDPRKMAEGDVASLWYYDFSGKVDKVIRDWIPLSHYAFHSAAINGNKVATEYFLQKLTREEREELLVDVAGKTYIDTYSPLGSNNVFCFLLSEMNEDQQIKMFHIFPYALGCLLEWPWQPFFLEIVYGHVFEMSGSIFGSILHIIIRKAANYTDYSYQRLFEEFWKLSSKYNCYSDLFDNNYQFCHTVQGLLMNKDRKNLELILKYATPEQRKKYSPDPALIYQLLKKVDDRDLLKLFVDECICSLDLLRKFVEVLNAHLLECFMNREDVCTVVEIFEYLRPRLVLLGKRCLELADERTAKRLRTSMNSLSY